MLGKCTSRFCTSMIVLFDSHCGCAKWTPARETTTSTGYLWKINVKFNVKFVFDMDIIILWLLDMDNILLLCLISTEAIY